MCSGKIKQANESGLLNLVQTIAVVAALGFTAYQIAQAADSFRATVVSDISSQSAALQLEILKDPALRPILTGETPAGEAAQADAALKRGLAAGLVINHFALIYDLYQLDGIPEDVWQTFANDMAGTLRSPGFRQRWAQVKRDHRPSFVAYVDKLLAS